MTKKRLLAVIIFVIASQLQAVLGPIVITVSTEYRTENPVIDSIASTIKLDRAEIEATGARTFLELLASIPSVNVFNQIGNVPSVFIRGTQSHNTLLLIDGVRVQDNSTPEGAPNLAVIPLEQIERIEIIKGPYSSLYGSNAIGGVIQVFTRKDTNSGHIEFSYGTHNSEQKQIYYGTKLDKLSLSFGASDYKTNGISVHQLDLSNDHDGTDKESRNINVNYGINNKLSIGFKFLEDKSDIQYDNSFATVATITGNNRLVTTNFIQRGVNIDYQYSNDWQAKLLLANSTQHRQTFNDDSVDNFNNNINSEEYTWINNIVLSDNQLLTAGYAYFKDKNQSFGAQNGLILSNKDIFAQYQNKLSDKLDILVGYRHINHQIFDSENTYNIGWGFQVNPDLKLTTAYGTGFKAPVFGQLFDAPFSTGNPNLNPEISQNIEFGIDYIANFARTKVNIYSSKIKDDIIGIFDLITFTTLYSNQAQDLISKGIDLEIIFALITGYDISFSHHYNSSQFENSNTQELRRPKNSTNLMVNKSDGKFNAHLQVIKKSSSIDTGNIELNGYILVNTLTSYRYKDKTKISFSINNVFDKNYTVANHYNQLGRTINLGLNYKF